MKTIPLTQGYLTKVDDEDYIKFASVRWYALVARSGVRAVRDVRINGERRHLHLSREILNAPRGRYVDHINGDTLDNRKQNLRFCTASQNQWNRQLGKNNISGFKGVFLDKRDDRWYPAITVNKKRISLGGFLNKKDAIKAYDKAAKHYFGEFAKLNI